MDDIVYIKNRLHNLVNPESNAMSGVSAEADIGEHLDRLETMIKEVVEFSARIADGDLGVHPPKKNYIANNIKTLQSKMLHVCWQTSQIAKGDYSQRLEFMGEFSDVFNWMIVEIRQRENELTAYRDVMIGVFNSINSIILLIEPGTGEIVYLNRAAMAETDVRAGQKISDHESWIGNLMELNKPDMPPFEFFDKELGKWYLISSNAIHWNMGKTLWLYSCADITKDKTERENLEKAAQIDSFTGVYNHAVGVKLLDEVLTSLKTDEQLCICYMDLDGLKRVNDTYGHIMGDKMIKRFVKGLNDVLRKQDLTIRMGGDEFLIIFQHMEKSIVEKVICRIVKYFENENDESGIPVLFSYGLVRISADDKITSEEIIKNADEEMYRNKVEKKANR